jgi:methyl-accepting chemotaxis protein
MIHWSIPRRVGLGFTLLVLAGAVIGLVSLWQLSLLGRQIHWLSKNTVPSVVTLARVNRLNLLALQAARSAVLDTDEPTRAAAARVDMERAIEQGDASCVEYEGYICDAEDGRLFAAAREARRAFVAQVRRAMALADEKNLDVARMAIRSEIQPLLMKSIDAFVRTIDYNTDESNRQMRVAEAKIRSGFVFVAAAVSAMVIFGLGMAVGIMRSLSRGLLTISDSLEAGASRTAASSSQLASVSQTVATGCSEQGASVAETGAALEQMSAMTRTTAENAARAKEYAGQARTAAEAGSRTMTEMDAAMEAIATSSGEVAKIVKQIDEIAFQTNILALNAAVEAARAGQAGAGFAVVADEVRLLAQRSAAAAKETADRIDAAIESSRHGAASCGRVGTSLHEIADRITAADQLVAEIATAAREQSQGIRQISTAMTQLDQVTQENATRADEGARAAADLSDQADAVQVVIEKLRSLVTATRPRPAAARSPAARPALTPPRRPSPAPRIPMPGDGRPAEPAPDAEDRHFTRFPGSDE